MQHQGWAAGVVDVAQHVADELRAAFEKLFALGPQRVAGLERVEQFALRERALALDGMLEDDFPLGKRRFPALDVFGAQAKSRQLPLQGTQVVSATLQAALGQGRVVHLAGTPDILGKRQETGQHGCNLVRLSWCGGEILSLPGLIKLIERGH